VASKSQIKCIWQNKEKTDQQVYCIANRSKIDLYIVWQTRARLNNFNNYLQCIIKTGSKIALTKLSDVSERH